VPAQQPPQKPLKVLAIERAHSLQGVLQDFSDLQEPSKVFEAFGDNVWWIVIMSYDAASTINILNRKTFFKKPGFLKSWKPLIFSKSIAWLNKGNRKA
jgi:hypothetical protein